MFADTRDSIHKCGPRLSGVAPPQSRNCGALATERRSWLRYPSVDLGRLPTSRQSICLPLGPVTAPLFTNRCQYDNRLRKINFFSESVLKSRLCADFSQLPQIPNILLERDLLPFSVCENPPLLGPPPSPGRGLFRAATVRERSVLTSRPLPHGCGSDYTTTF